MGSFENDVLLEVLTKLPDSVDSKILTQTLKRYPEIKEILDKKGIEITTRKFKLKNPSVSI